MTESVALPVAMLYNKISYRMIITTLNILFLTRDTFSSSFDQVMVGRKATLDSRDIVNMDAEHLGTYFNTSSR